MFLKTRKGCMVNDIQFIGTFNLETAFSPCLFGLLEENMTTLVTAMVLKVDASNFE